jgi:hypothetical protein
MTVCSTSARRQGATVKPLIFFIGLMSELYLGGLYICNDVVRKRVLSVMKTICIPVT